MIIVIGIIFLIILVIGHELGHFFAAKAFRLRVDELGFGFPPRIFAIKRKETTYSFNLLPFGGFVKIHGEHGDRDKEIDEPERSFNNQTAWKRGTIIAAGAFMNFLIGWIAISIVFALGVPNRVVIGDVLPDSPAADAGLTTGQTIEGYESTEEFINFVTAHRGEEILINGLAVTPRVNPPAGEGAIGVTVVDAGLESQGFIKSIWSGLVSAVTITFLIAGAFIGFLGNIFGGDFGVVEQVTGPVGIFRILEDVTELGIASLVQFLGLISLNLVVINLIPFPALDGGRFLTIVIEKVIGRRLNYKFELAANAVGLGLLLLLMVIVTIKDVKNIL